MNAGFPLSQSNIWMLLGVLALTFVAKALVTLMTIRSGAFGRRAAARHRIRFHAGCDARPRMDTDVSDRFGNRVCLESVRLLLLSASQQAPLMAMCLVMELSCEAPITFFVPVGMAVATSSLISKWLLSRK